MSGPLGVFLSQTMEQKAQKLKEFLVKVENRYRENEQVKYHHKPKVNYGTSNASKTQIVEIKTQQEQAWNDYKDLIMTSEKCIFEQKKTKERRQRILRVSQTVLIYLNYKLFTLKKELFIINLFPQYPNSIPTSSRKEEPFFHYYKILPFLQAARKIVLRNRLIKALSKLQNITLELISKFEEPFVKNYSLTLKV